MADSTQIDLPKELHDAFENKLEKEGLDEQEVVRNLMGDYLEGVIKQSEIPGTKRNQGISRIVYFTYKDKELWNKFKSVCSSNDKDPNAVLVDLIDRYTRS